MEHAAANPTVDTYFQPQFRATDVSISKAGLEELLLDTAVMCNWPFEQFDNPHFQKLIKRGFLGHTCPSRKTITSLLKTRARSARAEIKEKMEGNSYRISLALDCWTSPNRWEFMGIFPNNGFVSIGANCSYLCSLC